MKICDEHLYQLEKGKITSEKLPELVKLYRDAGHCLCCSKQDHIECCRLDDILGDQTMQYQHQFNTSNYCINKNCQQIWNLPYDITNRSYQMLGSVANTYYPMGYRIYR